MYPEACLLFSRGRVGISGVAGGRPSAGSVIQGLPDKNLVISVEESTMKRIMLPAAVVLFLASSLACGDDIWHVKAVDVSGQFIDIKAVDNQGNIYDVKAIPDGNLHLMDVKALVNGQQWPVKILVAEDQFAPVKAIGPDGTILDIKALTKDGQRLDVKGVSRAGNIIHIKAIGPEPAFYGVKAISPAGNLHDVKGLKMFRRQQEAVINGVPVEAHIKALPPGYATGLDVWNVKAIHPDGMMLNLKALDANGNIFDVKALAEAGNQHLFDVKAFVGDEILPVKILLSDDELAPVKAIGQDGTVYDVKARLPNGSILDVKGVARHGSIIDVKAIAADGRYYGVKAISRAGQLLDIKGVKMSAERQEAVINGIAVEAHVKALPQVQIPDQAAGLLPETPRGSGHQVRFEELIGDTASSSRSFAETLLPTGGQAARRLAAMAFLLGVRTFQTSPTFSINRIIIQLVSHCHHSSPCRADVGKAW
jgi:hypothetical protein